jgi:hypothetical protein
MTEAKDKLKHDLTVVEAMVAEMEEYLLSDVLFWPIMKGGFPRLTLGGYLMRHHRLSALTELLDRDDVERLRSVVGQFNEALVERVVLFENKAHQEIRARLRQWGEYLKDLKRASGGYGQNYTSAVETRAMLQSLIQKLEMPPYRLDKQIGKQLSVYDKVLGSTWRSGDFIWPDAWQSAYPRTSYWWLYGSPVQ